MHLYFSLFVRGTQQLSGMKYFPLKYVFLLLSVEILKFYSYR